MMRKRQGVALVIGLVWCGWLSALAPTPAEAQISFRAAASAGIPASSSATITFRASAQAGRGSGTLTLPINKPTGTVQDDVMIATIGFRPNTATITPPSGWTLIRRIDDSTGTPSSLAVYRKVAGASEPASYSWSFSTSSGSAGGILTFSGVDTASPIDVENGQNTLSSLTHSTPSITTSVANTMLVASYSFASSATWTTGSGMTEAVDVASQALGCCGQSTAAYYIAQAAAGATGAKAATASNDGDNAHAHLLALRPASLGGSLTINKPAGTVENDVMIASIGVRPNTVTVTPPAGWTLVRRMDSATSTTNSLAVYHKVAGASEPASYTWAVSAHTGAAGGIQTFAGVDTTTPIDVENGWATAAATTHSTPDVTTTVANTMLVTSHGVANYDTWAPPAGMTEAFDIRGGGEGIEGNYVLQAAAGPTGQKTATDQGPDGIDGGNAHILALRPYVCPGVWCYLTGAASLAPPALDPWSNMVVLGSNDNRLHGVTDSTGIKPVGFTPFTTGGPIQSRAAVLPSSYRTPASALNVAYVTSQDGYAYAVRTDTGAQVWQSAAQLGDTLQGGAGVWIQALQALTFTGGVTSDVVFVGTSNTAGSFQTNNKVYALNGATGATVWTFTPGNMDIISSTPYVDYVNNAVWVTSRSNSSTQPSVWKINAANGALVASWSLDQSSTALGDVDSTPVPNADGAYVYVGTNGGKLNAILSSSTTNNTNILTHTPGGGTGSINGMPWPLSYVAVGVATPDTIIFTRRATIHSVSFDGSTFTSNWTTTLTGSPTVSAPVDDGANRLYIGASDGKVHQLDVLTGIDQAQATISASGFDKGFNFRSSSGYVTDGANETYVLGDTYPTTRNGVTFGWVDAISVYEAGSTLDRRLAGVNYVANNTGKKQFRVDLPATGTYRISLALGTAGTAITANTLELRDNTTVLTTMSANTASSNFLDASGVSRTAANWPSQNVAIEQTFATTTFIAAIGTTSAGGDYSTIAHLRIVRLGTVGDPTFNVDLNQLHVGATDGRIYTFGTPF